MIAFLSMYIKCLKSLGNVLKCFLFLFLGSTQNSFATYAEQADDSETDIEVCNNILRFTIVILYFYNCSFLFVF